MELLLVLGKGIGSLIVMFVFTKLMGKKQVGQLTLFDYIIGISLGSIAAAMTVEENITFLEGSVGIALYAVIAFFISKFTSKSIIARRFFTGTPSILIQNGKILENSLSKNNLDVNDLLQLARIQGYFDISKIEYAIMEPNGNISFLLKSKYQPVIRNDLKIKSDYEGICAEVVIDGKIMHENLKFINKKEEWLIKRLSKQGYNNLDNLFLVTIDSKEKLAIFEKNIGDMEFKVLE